MSWREQRTTARSGNSVARWSRSILILATMFMTETSPPSIPVYQIIIIILIKLTIICTFVS
jgi:hypothetical protein